MISRQPSTDELTRSYLRAKRAVIDAGYAEELRWQSDRRLQDITDVEFVRQSAWVVLSAGMRETVVRAVFPSIGEALHHFVPPQICSDPRTRSAALRVFRHERKIDAILSLVRIAEQLGTSGLRQELASGASSLLHGLPYMGPATTRHLAKNLGIPVAKPDRHLVRITESFGRASTEAMCDEIGSWLEEPVAVVDIVLWRWATIHQRQCDRATCSKLPHD